MEWNRQQGKAGWTEKVTSGSWLCAYSVPSQMVNAQREQSTCDSRQVMSQQCPLVRVLLDSCSPLNPALPMPDLLNTTRILFHNCVHRPLVKGGANSSSPVGSCFMCLQPGPMHLKQDELVESFFVFFDPLPKCHIIAFTQSY